MEKIKVLKDWTGYLNTKPDIVYSNCLAILAELIQNCGSGSQIRLIGIGYSGAQLCSALQMVNIMHHKPVNISYIVFRKEERGSSLSEPNERTKTIILDDDIMTGRSIKEIHRQMGYKGMSRGVVEGIIARPGTFLKEEEIQEIITTHFHSIKFWIK